MLNRDAFWRLIDGRDGTSSCDDQADRLVEILAKHSPDEIIAFGEHLDGLMATAYRWDLWAVAHIINGGCSDAWKARGFRCRVSAAGPEHGQPR